MIVKCKGYNICRFKDECYHSKQHEQKMENGNGHVKCLSNTEYSGNCVCASIKIERKKKLEKLNK